MRAIHLRATPGSRSIHPAALGLLFVVSAAMFVVVGAIVLIEDLGTAALVIAVVALIVLVGIVLAEVARLLSDSGDAD
jgi:uncharacterized membrane protein